MKIIFISCVSEKAEGLRRAEDLYVSPWFKKALKYARYLKEKSQVPAEIFILSAKHGILSLDEKIEAYDVTLNNMGVAAKKEWSKKVISQLIERRHSSEDTQFTFLAGQNYRKYILEFLCLEESDVHIPMKDMQIGKQLQFLKRELTALGLE